MSFPTMFHLTARVPDGDIPFPTRAHYAWLWARLRIAFPRAVASTLMPSHLHVITPCDRVAGLHKLAKILGAYTRKFGTLGVSWSVSAKNDPIQDRHHLGRQIRYVLLNPCRDRLVKDPLSWEWSTHRDVMGAAYPAWVTPAKLAPYFGFARDRFGAEFHAYISGDPSCAVQGTVAPRFREGLIPSLSEVGQAVLIAMREPSLRRGRGVRNSRRMIIYLAFRYGHPSHQVLADLLGVNDRAVRWVLERSPTVNEERAIRAAQWVLSDRRLLGPSTLFAALRRVTPAQTV